jgi:hypothetical protein
LEPGRVKGAASSRGRAISWDLSFRGDAEPLFLLPLDLYARRLPRAKTVVGLPMAFYEGMISVDGAAIEVRDWLGSQNHNWGSRHTDLYAWGQVAGFDTHPDSSLEVATARIKIGPFWTPYMTPMVLRHEGEEFALNRLLQTIRARGSFSYFEWTFGSKSKDIEIEGKISAPREAFAGLSYYNPPGGTKHCLNSKIATCEVAIKINRSGQTAAVQQLSAKRRAAFEILTDDRGHGIEISA